MKVGDYVARVKDLKNPDEMEAIGLIVKKIGDSKQHTAFWLILINCGSVEIYSEKYLEVISESRRFSAI